MQLGDRSRDASHPFHRGVESDAEREQLHGRRECNDVAPPGGQSESGQGPTETRNESAPDSRGGGAFEMTLESRLVYLAGPMQHAPRAQPGNATPPARR